MRNKRYGKIRRDRRSFTLMEVLVAMAVFTVMMTILLDFFVGTQKLWSGTDSKNELYSDARVAMDLVSSTLQSSFYDHGSTMFLFGTNNNAAATREDAVFFPVKMPVDYGSEEELYYLSLLWNKTGNAADETEDATLYLRTLGKKDGENNYKALFEPTGGDSAKIDKKANNSVVGLRQVLKLDAKAVKNPSRKVIGGVMSMSFRPIHVAGLPLPPNPPADGHVRFYRSGELDSESSFKMDGANPTDVRELMPFGVQVSMQMLSKQHFLEWKNLGGTMANLGTSDEPEAARDFRLANTRQFDRIIYLGFK